MEEIKFLTAYDYARILKKANESTEKLPKGYKRIRIKHFNDKIREYVKNAKGRKPEPLNKNLTIIYLKEMNLGNRTYPDFVSAVNDENYTHETEKTFNSHILKNRVICFIK